MKRRICRGLAMVLTLSMLITGIVTAEDLAPHVYGEVGEDERLVPAVVAVEPATQELFEGDPESEAAVVAEEAVQPEASALASEIVPEEEALPVDGIAVAASPVATDGMLAEEAVKGPENTDAEAVADVSESADAETAENVLEDVEKTATSEEEVSAGAVDTERFEGDETIAESAIEPTASACPHENRITERYERDTAFSDGDENGHIRSYIEVTAEYCEDCDEYLSESASSERTKEFENHFFEGGVCDACGYVNTCAHAHQYEAYFLMNCEYSAGDASGHTVRYNKGTQVYCQDCYELLSETVSEAWTEEREDHDFRDGVCVFCDYVNECAHVDTHTFESALNPKYSAGDANGHTKRYKHLIQVFCEDCGECLSETVSEAWTEEREEHYFQNGACENCGYANSCEHRHTQKETAQRDARYTAGDAGGHIVRYHKVEYVHCLDCGEEISQTVSKEWTEEKEPHFPAHGICDACGYGTACPHKNVYTGVESFDPSYAQKDANSHLVTWAQREIAVCLDCDKVLSERVLDEKREIRESHYFTDGVCECGYRNGCVHENQESSATLAGWELTGSDAEGHTHQGYRQETYYCFDCGETWCGEIEDEKISERSEHNFSNGVCVECGYANGCKHKNVEEVTEFMTGMTGRYGSITDCDEKGHTVSGSTYKVRRCRDCYEELSWEVVNPQVSRVEEHFFERGICICGYENPCEHAHKSVINTFSEYVQKDERVHTGLGQKIADTTCDDCGEWLGRKLIGYDVKEDEAHWFNDAILDGKVCVRCRYE